MTDTAQAATEKQSVLHICNREMLRPLRDQILRISGFSVKSASTYDEGLAIFRKDVVDLVLIDVEGEERVGEAERLCSAIRTAHHGQLVAFLCNWRVAILTDCPDEIVRAEFDPAAFVEGVRKTLAAHPA